MQAIRSNRVGLKQKVPRWLCTDHDNEGARVFQVNAHVTERIGGHKQQTQNPFPGVYCSYIIG